MNGGPGNGLVERWTELDEVFSFDMHAVFSVPIP
jgi:hypothetical protein